MKFKSKFWPRFTRPWWWGWIVLLSGIAAAESGEQVRVLVSSNVAIPVAVLKRAEDEAVRIFEAAGIQLAWINCLPSEPRPECEVRPGENLLFLHIVAARNFSTDTVYGEAFLDHDKGDLADLFYDRVEDAQRDGVNAGRLLGAVAAHELGHLLLGSHSHLWIGIMTPVWTGENLRLVGMGALYFTKQQAVRMRERLQSGNVLKAEK